MNRTRASLVALWTAGLLCLFLAGCDNDQPRYASLPADATVLAFGDSVTHGTGAGIGEDYPTLLARASGWRVLNGGMPGDMAARANDRLVPLLREYQPDLVLISLGGNDLLRRRSEGTVKEDLRQIVATVRSAGSLPVLIAVPEVSAVRATLGNLKDAALYRELAVEEDLLLIEGVFAEVLSRSELRTDPIHPNAKGYRHFAHRVLEALEDAGLYQPGQPPLTSD